MSNSVELVYGGKWASMQEKLKAVADVSARMGDTTVATVAAIGRRQASEYEEHVFNMGEEGGYWKNWKKDPTTRRGTEWDEQLGGFVSRTYKVHGRGLREMGFSFENQKAKRNKYKFLASVSKASMYSLTANLWEKPHTMGYGSEKYQWSYDGSNWFFWKSGETRPGKHFFLTGVRSIVKRSVPEAIDRVENEYRKELENL